MHCNAIHHPSFIYNLVSWDIQSWSVPTLVYLGFLKSVKKSLYYILCYYKMEILHGSRRSDMLQ